MGLKMYSHGKRTTGRTEMLIHAVSDGDTIVTTNHVKAGEIRARLEAAGKSVRVVIDDPTGGAMGTVERLAANYDRVGYVWFDHHWYEAYYFYGIRALSEAKKALQKEFTERKRLYEAEKAAGG